MPKRLLKACVTKAIHILRNTELSVLLATFALVLGLWVFIEVADEVGEREYQDLDEAAVLYFRNPDNPRDIRGPEWLDQSVRDVSSLGGITIMGLLTLLSVGYVLLSGRPHLVGLLLGAVLGGLLLGVLLKAGFDRPRPQIVPQLDYVVTQSFPSGHSMLSAVVYLTLGAVLTRAVHRRRLKIYFLAAAALVSGLVGLSRVMLGVHYPTDVLAGWSVGLAWAMFCWLVAMWLQRRGAVEADVDASD
jgi:undecaprenyl-diphosphatase